MRLGPHAPLPPDVMVPVYDRDAQAIGMVHIGVGAFHRAHQAVYADDAMAAGDRDWMIQGVSLRSDRAGAALNPQGGLYSVAERDEAGERLRVMGALKGVLSAGADDGAILAAIAAPQTHVVTLTITEKGYVPEASGAPATAAGWLAWGLMRRRAAGLGGLTLVSCDNLSANGQRLGELVLAALAARDTDTAAWFLESCACPSSMVDRIVPAATPAVREAAERRLGVSDAAALAAEPFRQWVIEDRFAGRRPLWEAGGAQFVTSVAPFEMAKLRLLNGAHSAMAAIGLPLGLHHEHEAAADPDVAALVRALMAESAATLTSAPGLDPADYQSALWRRWRNAALPHRLAQIAIDSSQKIPQRWLGPLAERRARGLDSPALLTARAAWALHMRGDGAAVDDPQSARLVGLWQAAGMAGIAAALCGEGGLFADRYTASPQDLACLSDSVAALEDPAKAREVLRGLETREAQT